MRFDRRRRLGALGSWSLVALLLPGLALAETKSDATKTGKKAVGYVDGSAFVDLAGGEDAIALEVSISRTLLSVLARGYPDLQELLGGIDSIEAVVLDLGEKDLAAARGKAKELGGRLRDEGWERLMKVREDDAEVSVLVLNSEEEILGLVVMALEKSEKKLVFVNIAGNLDLAAIEAIGEQLDVPGLEDIDF